MGTTRKSTKAATRSRSGKGSKPAKKPQKKPKKVEKPGLLGRGRKPKPCTSKKLCQYIEDITSNQQLPLPIGTGVSDRPWLEAFYLGYIDVFYAAVRLELIAQDLLSKHDDLDPTAYGLPIFIDPNNDKAGAPPPPKFPPD